jgi:2-dehydropantoate 2-reductase
LASGSVKIAVVGAGGIGSLFGGRLAAAGHCVWLIHRRPDVVHVLRAQGLHLESANGVERIPVNATIDAREVGEVDLVLVLTKSNDTRSAADASRSLVGAGTLVLTLQNGLGNDAVLGEVLGPERVLLGMTYAGAAFVTPGHVRHTAPGATFVGDPAGAPGRAERLAQLFTAAGLPTSVARDLSAEIWGKLLINSAMNATCALTGASGTAALRSPAARDMLRRVAIETAAVAVALGVRLPYADPAARVLQHCRDVADAKPSMLQDMERERPTEIEAINGAIVREADRLGVPTPYNRALLLLVRAREEVARA